MSAAHKSEKTETATHHSPKKNDSKPKLLILLIVLVLLGVLIVLRANKSSDKVATNTSNTSNNASQGDAKLYLKPASNEAPVGSSVTFEVWVDTANQPVNAVQANLTYPIDKFDFSSIDAKGSAFEIQALSKGGDGKISIARGHIGDVKGKALIAKVVLVTKVKGDAKIEFTTGSAVVRSTDHVDILKDKAGGSFKISKSASNIAIIPFKIT